MYYCPEGMVRYDKWCYKLQSARTFIEEDPVTKQFKGHQDSVCPGGVAGLTRDERGFVWNLIRKTQKNYIVLVKHKVML